MRKGNVGVILIIAVLISFICGSLGAYAIIESGVINVGDSNVVSVGRSSVNFKEDNSLAEGVSRVYDAVVVVEGYSSDNLASSGTGFIYKKTKDTYYVMTNHHVINGVEKVKIILSDTTVVDATVKGSEVYSDIAVLAVSSNSIKGVAVLGDSTKLNVGDTVFAIGSPEGADYAGTVTKGVLSGKDRLVAVALNGSDTSDYYMRVIQTDAAINPGNSGGPLCNVNGDVIGITNMKLVDSTVEGMGFAIPIEDALLYASKLEKGETIVRPYFGVGMLDLTNSYLLWQNGITVPSEVKEGVVITQVAEGSPAEKAGLKKGDIIISLADKKVKSIAEFRYELYKHEVGEEVEMEYYRSGKVKKGKIKLAENKQ